MKNSGATKAQILLLAGLVFATNFLSVKAFARSGEGSNGPQTEGDSIPVISDGPISKDKVETAFKICLVRGNKKKGQTSFLMELSRVTKTDGKASNLFNLIEIEADATTNSDEWSRSDDYIGVNFTLRNLFLSFKLDPMISAFFDQQTSRTEFMFQRNKVNEHLVLEGLPYLTAAKEVQQELYDELGSVIKIQTYYQDLKINRAQVLDKEGHHIVKSTNEDTKKQIFIPLSTDGYLNCLKSELSSK